MKARFKQWFIDNINWCEAKYSDGRDKPENRVLNWFYEHWLWPWDQNDCLCCNTTRGLIYGLVMGMIIGGLLF